MPDLPNCLQIALEPGSSAPFKIVAGVATLHSGDLDLAERLFHQVIELVPEASLLATAHGGLGVAAKTRGRHEEAAEHLEHALELHADCWELHYQLAETAMLLGDDLAALIAIFRALELDSSGAAAGQIERNPFFADFLTHPEVADRVTAGLHGRAPGDAATPLFPASAWPLWEAEMIGAQVNAAMRGAPGNWADAAGADH